MSPEDNQSNDETHERVGFVFDCDFFLRGSFQVPGYVILDPDLSDAACRTLLVIMQHAWKDGECYPGIQRLADMRGKGRQAVIRHISELVDLGHLTKHRRGQGKTNLYVINTQRQVVMLRGVKNGTSGSIKNGPQSIGSLIPFALISDEVAADGESRPMPGNKRERVQRTINLFRDSHYKATGVRYMVREPQDRVLAASMVKTYADEQVAALMSLYFGRAHASYTFGGFYKSIPSLITDYEAVREDKKAERVQQTEIEMLERMITEWDKGLTERRMRIEDLEGKLERLTGEQRIPDADMRKRLETVQGDLMQVYKSLLTSVCKTLGVPPILKRELHSILNEDYTEARGGLVQMLKTRQAGGGD